MKKRNIKEQDMGDKKMPGMTSYDPGNPLENKEKPQGGGLSGSPSQETPKVDKVDLKVAQQKCSFLQNTDYLPPSEGETGEPVLHKIADKDLKNTYSKGDYLYYTNDFKIEVYGADGNFKTVGKWSCKALNPEPIKKEEPKPKFTTDQQSIINYQIQKQQKVEACNDVSYNEGKEKCAPVANIGIGEYVPVDLNVMYPDYFKPKEKILYHKSSAAQEYSGSQMTDWINYYKRGENGVKWFTTDEISANDIYKYRPHNLRKLHPEVFKQDYVMYELFSDSDCEKVKKEALQDPTGGLKKLFGADKVDLTNVNREDCNQAIDTLYTFVIKGCNMESITKENLKDYAKRCKTQNKYGKRAGKLLDELINISKNDPDQRKRSFSLAESKISLKQSIHESLKEIKKLKESVNNRKKSIKHSIHENLLNIKEQKRINTLENEIMKKRIDFVVESYKKSKSFDKFLRDVIYEFNYMSKQNFGKTLLSEATSEDNLLNYLGRKVPGAPEMLVDKLVTKIAEKMDAGQGSWWVDKVTSEFLKDEDISVPKILELDCSYIVSKFSKTFERILKDKTQTAPDGMIELVKSSLDGAIENYFKSDFEKELKSKICPIVSSFASKLKDTEEMLNKKLVSQEPSGSDRLNAPVMGEFGS